MGIDLVGATREYSLSNWGWSYALDLAASHGWKPAGVIAVPQDDWGFFFDDEDALLKLTKKYGLSDSYNGSDWNFVTKRDASGMADALQRAVDQEAKSPRQVKPSKDDFLLERDVDEFPEMLINGLIDFCRAGPFRIG